MHRPLKIVAIVLLLSSLGSCSEGGPSKADVGAYLSAKLSDEGAISINETENFPGESGKGRISASGTITLKENIYSRAQDDSLFQYLNKTFEGRNGWYNAVQYKVGKLYGYKDLFNMIGKKGDSHNFVVDILYRKTVSGYEFDGDLPNVPRGLRSSHLGRDALVIGSEEFSIYVQRFVEIDERRKKLEGAILGRLNEWMAAGTLETYCVSRNSARKMFTIRLEKNQELYYENNAFNNPIASFDGTAYWVSDGLWANSGFKKGQEIRARNLVQANIDDNDDWGATMFILVPNELLSGQLYHTGTALRYATDPERYEGKDLRCPRWVVIQQKK